MQNILDFIQSLLVEFVPDLISVTLVSAAIFIPIFAINVKLLPIIRRWRWMFGIQAVLTLLVVACVEWMADALAPLTAS